MHFFAEAILYLALYQSISACKKTVIAVLQPRYKMYGLVPLLYQLQANYRKLCREEDHKVVTKKFWCANRILRGKVETIYILKMNLIIFAMEFNI